MDNGIPLSLCLRKFSHWLHKLSQDFQICLAGERAVNTGDASLKLAAIVTWSGKSGVVIIWSGKSGVVIIWSGKSGVVIIWSGKSCVVIFGQVSHVW